ncbi:MULTISPECIES: hypothetical protein [unclassified Ochrobactrum]|uniref:hypothetical protein n=1 Tax=unclassified Ochrobactrum TaxID=239106 RepID=UPI0030A3D028
MTAIDVLILFMLIERVNTPHAQMKFILREGVEGEPIATPDLGVAEHVENRLPHLDKYQSDFNQL